MTRRVLTYALSGVLALAVGCASAPPERMRRALDPTMERVLRTETYLRTVAGISSHPSRLARGDGFVYTSDVAPILRYLADSRDTVRFRELRGFVTQKLVRRAPSGLELARRYRDREPLQRATPYGYLWMTRALADGWQLVGDTASALVLAQLEPLDAAPAQSPSAMYQLSIDCADAVEIARTDPAPARAVLARARRFVGSEQAAKEQAALGSTAVEGEVDLLSCLTRVGIAVQDPDATVRYLEDLLGHLNPMLSHSGRPDLGTAADILLTLRRVREAGPEYARSSVRGTGSR